MKDEFAKHMPWWWTRQPEYHWKCRIRWENGYQWKRNDKAKRHARVQTRRRVNSFCRSIVKHFPLDSM